MENLIVYGVQEMNAKEMKKTDGGGWFPWNIVGGIIIGGLLWEVITDGTAQCWEDFMEGYNSTQ